MLSNYLVSVYAFGHTLWFHQYLLASIYVDFFIFYGNHSSWSLLPFCTCILHCGLIQYHIVSWYMIIAYVMTLYNIWNRILYDIASYGKILFYMIQYCIIRHDKILYHVIWYNIVPCNMIWYCVKWYCITSNNILSYNLNHIMWYNFI